MSALVEIVIFVTVIYLVLAAALYAFQHYFFFRPEILPTNFTYSYPFDFEERTFEMEDGGSVNSLHFKVPNSRGLVYYFKGNSRSIKGWAKFATQFIGNGFDFFVMDYRGFGKSKGRRTEQKLYNDSQHIYRFLEKQYDQKNIVVYGRSLGSGIAARIASWNEPALLILDSPYYSFKDYVRRWAFLFPLNIILRYKMRTDQFLQAVNAPICIVHGDRDRLIPIHHSRRLVELAPDRIRLKVVEGGGHNNLPDFPDFHELMYELLNQVSHPKTEEVPA